MILTYREFAKALNMSYNTVKQHVHRGKISSDGKYINTQEEKNVKYINTRTGNKGIDLIRSVEMDEVILTDEEVLRRENLIQRKLGELALLEYVEGFLKINIETVIKTLGTKDYQLDSLKVEMLKFCPAEVNSFSSKVIKAMENSMDSIKLETTKEVNKIISSIKTSESMKTQIKQRNYASNN